MKEIELRKWHRRMGIGLALFLFLQAASGILLSLEGLPISGGWAHTEHGMGTLVESTAQTNADPLGFLHHGGGGLGAVYRLALGAATLWMALSGSWIYLKIRRRSAAKKQ